MTAPPPTGLVPAPKNIDRLVKYGLLQETPLWRVHEANTDPRRFNPRYGPPTRFAFFNDHAGMPVPVWYGGQVLEVAIAETLFHDLPLTAGAVLPAAKYLDRAYSKVAPRRHLVLGELAGDGLRALGIRAGDVTDTDAIEYVDTVEWARAIHDQHWDVQGLTWMSRQFNTHRSVILFGDRVTTGDLDVDIFEHDIPLAYGTGLGHLVIASDRARVLLEPPTAKYLTK